MTTPAPTPSDVDDNGVTVDQDDIAVDLDDFIDMIPLATRAKLYRVALGVSTVLGGLMFADVIPDGGVFGKLVAGVTFLASVLGNGVATAYTRPAK